MYNVSHQLAAILTNSDYQWEEALNDLKQQNIDGVYERLNPDPEEGIGDIGKSLFQCFENVKAHGLIARPLGCFRGTKFVTIGPNIALSFLFFFFLFFSFLFSFFL